MTWKLTTLVLTTRCQAPKMTVGLRASLMIPMEAMGQTQAGVKMGAKRKTNPRRHHLDPIGGNSAERKYGTFRPLHRRMTTRICWLRRMVWMTRALSTGSGSRLECIIDPNRLYWRERLGVSKKGHHTTTPTCKVLLAL